MSARPTPWGRAVWAHLRARSLAWLALPGDALLGAITDAALAAVWALAALAAMRHVPEIRGYALHDVLLVSGLAQISLGVYRGLFAGLAYANPKYLIGGALDRLLLRPVDPYLQILLAHLDPGAAISVIAGAVVFGAGAAGAAVAWTPLQIVLLPIFVLCGALLVAGLATAAAALGFWMHHRGSAVGLIGQLSGLASYPVDFLPASWALLATTVLPFAFVGFVPATLYMGRPLHETWALAQPLVGLGVFVASWIAWRVSVRRYGSSGH